MCMFSFDGRVHSRVKSVSVANTRIFARGLDRGRQAIVYSMNYESQLEVAMILALPTPAATAEDAVHFVDLSGYSRLFDDLQSGFPQIPGEEFLALSAGEKSRDRSPPKLKVYEVGSFQASFVPGPEDFARLDARFRLPDGVLNSLPMYHDHSFALFKLKPGSRTVHPMAFSFPRRDPQQLFFPTVHVHDGTVPDRAKFDHALYGQFDGPPPRYWETSFALHPYEESIAEWARIEAKKSGKELSAFELKLARRTYDGFLPMQASAGGFVNIEAAKGLVHPDKLVHRTRLHGLLKNEDTVLSDTR